VSSSAVSCGARCRGVSLALAAVAGAVFGAGLLISGMTQPAKVIGFLDVTRRWDPSLAFVMGGGVMVFGLAFRLLRRHRAAPWFDGAFHVPTRRDIDVSLIAGAAIFGVGWGLGGLCPGPGLVAAASGSAAGVAFVAAMLAGMIAQHAAARAARRGDRRT
jgi:uncharacterized protein